MCIYIINAWGCKELERENGIPWANNSRYVCQFSSLRIDPWKVPGCNWKKQWRFLSEPPRFYRWYYRPGHKCSEQVGCNRLRLISDMTSSAKDPMFSLRLIFFGPFHASLGGPPKKQDLFSRTCATLCGDLIGRARKLTKNTQYSHILNVLIPTFRISRLHVETLADWNSSSAMSDLNHPKKSGLWKTVGSL